MAPNSSGWTKGFMAIFAPAESLPSPATLLYSPKHWGTVGYAAI